MKEMTRSVVQQLASIGKHLAHPPHTKDSILKQLKIAAGMLSEMTQSRGLATTIEPLTRALVLPMFLRHKDADVRLLTTTCIMEIMRIVAPDAPYHDDELQEIFRLVVTAFERLDETSSPSFAKRTTILEIMANIRICVVMLDVGCDDLMLEMFHIFFSIVSDKHPSSVVSAMQTIMAAVLQESENIRLPLLDVILKNLLKHNKRVSAAAHKLAIGVVQQCADILEPYVQQLLTSVMLEGKAAEIDLHVDYHDIIHEIYQWAPQMLLAVIPNLTQELVSDQVDVRLKAVQLLGRLFALPGQHVAKEYRQLFSEFIKRFTDKAVEVRLAMIECVKACLKANPSESEATEILAGLDDRILDNEEIIRLHAVTAICDVAKQNLKWIPVSIITHIAERLRDKKVLVRKEAFQRLAEVYRTYCTKCYEGVASSDKHLEWIPSRLVRCCYDKDVKEFRPAALEILLSENLFPRQLSVLERTRHWIALYEAFEEMDKRALARVLLQKQRLQENMSEYLSLRQNGKELDTEDMQRLFKAMSLAFVDDHKAEENFQKLHNMKDKKIFKALAQLLDLSTSFTQCEEINDDLLKRIGESHPQHEFMRVLALRCSFRIFGKEHVKALLEEVTSNTHFSNKDTMAAGLSLLAEFSGFFPFLIQDVKEDLFSLLLEGDDIIKERVADILARAGSSICGQIDDSQGSVELTLQKICLEGSRKQAKYAVSALAALNVDGGFKALSILYGCLTECLQENNPHLATVLQSLSCIAQHAITVFETQEDDIVRFVVRTLLRRISVAEAGHTKDAEWESISPVCRLKIFGLKMLVKSFLPHKEYPRKRLKGLLGLLLKLCQHGEITESPGSSEIERAHLRFAAAKGILRLARRLDGQIPPLLYHSCVLTAQDPCMFVRQRLLIKIHQYLKDHTLSHRYASAYALFASDSSKEVIADAKHSLADFVEGCHRELRLQQKSDAGQTDAIPITYHPEYVLTYLVHVLAHHPSFPSPESNIADAYEPFYRILLFFLRALVHQESEGIGKRDAVDNLPAIFSIFRTLNKAEDAVEEKKTLNLHIVCDLGMVIAKELGRSRLHSDTFPGLIPLPSSFYKVREDAGDDSCKVDGSDLPPCLADTDALSQFWSRGLRLGQTLGVYQHSRKPKRDVEEGSSSDLGEECNGGVQVEKQSRTSESGHVMGESKKSSNSLRLGHKAQKTNPRELQMDSGAGDENHTSLETCKEGKVTYRLCTRNGNYSKQIVAEEHKASPATENVEKSPRRTMKQAVGKRILLGSKTLQSTPESERGKNVFNRRSVAKRLKLDNQLEDGAVVEQRDNRPQTRSRTAMSSSAAEMRSDLQSSPVSVINKKRKTAVADTINVLADSESTEAPGEQPVGEMKSPTELAYTGRVLRNQTKVQIVSLEATKRTAPTNNKSEQEPVATWRTRRRKVQ